MKCILSIYVTAVLLLAVGGAGSALAADCKVTVGASTAGGEGLTLGLLHLHLDYEVPDGATSTAVARCRATGAKVSLLVVDDCEADPEACSIAGSGGLTLILSGKVEPNRAHGVAICRIDSRSADAADITVESVSFASGAEAPVESAKAYISSVDCSQATEEQS